ncbi:MAG: hypothetical protein QM528_00270 [Phycisphaerales bacterium]|nr:hypothetical protein [Phycisphaerales bacterium]
MFDEKTIQHLRYYVYVLLDPTDNNPFYVGKGVGNRVFDHCLCALKDTDTSNAKYDKIREIIESKKEVNHIIVRHGLSEDEAFKIEDSLIDTLTYCGILLSNVVGGHKSIEKGLMTSEEIIRLYNAQPLNEMAMDCVLININKTYKRGNGTEPIYQATKETWLIQKSRLEKIKYVLSEFRGLVVEVFEVKNWYSKPRPKNKTIDKKNNIIEKVMVPGYGFDGVVAQDEIRNLYINKSVAHLKQKGAAQVIRYNLCKKK